MPASAPRVPCPQCDRPLLSLKQYHHCERKDIASLFEGKAAHLLPLYQQLEGAVKGWPGVQFSASKACVVFVVARAFLVVRVMKSALDLSFVLPEEREGFPIYQHWLRGKRHEHYIRLYDAEDLSDEVVDLIRISHGLAE